MRFLWKLAFYFFSFLIAIAVLLYLWSIPAVRGIASLAVVASALSTMALFGYSAFARKFGLFDPGLYHKLLFIPWRPLARSWLSFVAYLDNEWRAGKRATGGFAGTLHKLCLVYKPGDVFLGRLMVAGIGLFQPLGQRLERHLFMFAATGAGKTTLLITMLGLHPGNAFVIDPKGQMATILRRRRGKGGDGIAGLGKNVAVLDPYNVVSGVESDHWNPLDEIERAIEREGRTGAVKYAEKISEGLIRIEGKQPFFPRAARKFLTGLILHVLTTEPKEKRNMLRVYELITLGYRDELQEVSEERITSRTGFAYLLHKMSENREYSAIPAASATFDDSKSAGDVMATLKVALSVYDNEEVRAISHRSTFSLHDLKLAEQDVFVCAPVGAINGELSGWFRMLTVLGLGIFEYIQGDLRPKCFFAIDELPSLGNIEKLDKGPAVLRSYGVQLLGIAQTVQALKDAYPDTWTTWVGNADAVYWMATNDTHTAGYLAEILGDANRPDGDRAVLSSDQIQRYLDPSRGNMIVTRFGKRALKLKAAPYFQELPVKYYDPDPEHLEDPARASTRARISSSSGASYKTFETGQEQRRTPPKRERPKPKPEAAKRPKPKEKAKEPYDFNYQFNRVHRARQESHERAKAERANFSPAQEAQAMALFGLSGPCTLNELKKRKKMLEQRAEASPEYKRLVEEAFEILSQRMSA